MINQQYQRATSFSMSIQGAKFGDFTMQITDFTLPTVSSPAAQQATKFLDAKHPGSGIEYQSLPLRAIVTQGLANVKTMHQWMLDNLNEPEVYDITVTGYGSNDAPVFSIRFKDSFPIDIMVDPFSTSDQSDNILKFDVTLEYDQFEII